MGFFDNLFVDVKRGSKVTFSESDLRKLDRTYEKEILTNDKRRVMSPLRKVPQQAYLTQIRDYAFEKILDSHMYTFQYMLVIPNPYDIVKQSALILFNSSKETKVSYRVLGDSREADFCGETEYTKRHRVPIMGLYLKRSNKVELEMIDREGKVLKRRTIRIYVSETPKRLENINIFSENKARTNAPFIVVNGVSFNPMALDCNGAIRYSIQLKTNTIGMIPIENGKFLYEDRTANRMDKKGQIKPCRYHIIDYMGRVYKTFLMEFPIDGYATQYNNSLFMITSSDENHIGDVIVEMSMEDGSIIKKCDLSTIIGDKYKKIGKWIHISSIDVRNDKVLLSMKRLHAVLEIDWKKQEISWIVGSKLVWENNEKCGNKLLLPEIENDYSGISPTSAHYVKKSMESVLVFDSNCKTKIAAEISNDSVSNVKIINIETERKKYSTIKSIACDKTRLYGRSVFSKDNKSIVINEGVLEKFIDGNKCKIVEMDRDNGEEIRSHIISRGVNRIWEFLPNIESYSESVEITKDVILGKFASPEEFHGEIGRVEEENIPRTVFSSARLCEEIFLCNILPGSISRIFFIGENHKYVQDYTNMLPAKVKYSFAMSLSDFKVDEYTIYVESDGKVYKLSNEIRVIRE